MMENVLPLPVGLSDFRALRRAGRIYVDKTEPIARLARIEGSFFLARPRRFGKSVLISTLATLFRDGLKHFQGLYIENVWKDTTYQVVCMDFSEIKQFDDGETFQAKFYQQISILFGDVGFQPSGRYDLLIEFSRWLSSLETLSLVILIDEYDAPLTSCLDKPELFEKVRSTMSEFFMVLKSKGGCLRFLFMTGITKFSNTSIFSAFNNLQDISLDPAYGTILGLTDEEIRSNFWVYLENAANVLQMPFEEMMRALKANYDGFSFDQEASTHVYSPWSVFNFLNNPKLGFQDYWFESGGQPTVLLRYLKRHSLQSPTAYGQPIRYSITGLKAPRQYSEIEPEALLVQAGYLTIRSVEKNGDVVLGYPNEEVAISMAKLYAGEIAKSGSSVLEEAEKIRKLLSYGSPEEIVEAFNEVFDGFDYAHYPVRDEASCRALLQLMMREASLRPRIEVHNAKGRSDLEVVVDNRYWVFELKYVAKNSEAPVSLEKAISQMRDRRYGVWHAQGKDLVRLALVFSEEERAFVAWYMLDD